MKAFKLRLNGESHYIDDSLDNIAGVLEYQETEVGDIFTLEVIEISEEEFNNLPEFDGF